MNKQLHALLKPLLKTLCVVGLVLALVLTQTQGALAAYSGGRMGGGSFRMRSVPSRSYSAPSRSYRQPAPTYNYYPGGGFGFPFLLPFFGFGGGFGGLFSILIFMAVASFLVQTFRRFQAGDALGSDGYTSNPTVSVARLQVGLLSEARELRTDLEHLANTADTNTPTGRAQVLQETTLALLRHPEYWVYAGVESQQSKLDAAETQFNRYSLAERSKFAIETLSNVNGQVKQAAAKVGVLEKNGATHPEAPSEYIVVTILVGAEGKLELPNVRSSEELQRALGLIGGVGSDKLLAFEVLWTPEAKDDTLTADDLVVGYPNLRLI